MGQCLGDPEIRITSLLPLPLVTWRRALSLTILHMSGQLSHSEAKGRRDYLGLLELGWGISKLSLGFAGSLLG